MERREGPEPRRRLTVALENATDGVHGGIALKVGAASRSVNADARSAPIFQQGLKTGKALRVPPRLTGAATSETRSPWTRLGRTSSASPPIDIERFGVISTWPGEVGFGRRAKCGLREAPAFRIDDRRPIDPA